MLHHIKGHKPEYILCSVPVVHSVDMELKAVSGKCSKT